MSFQKNLCYLLVALVQVGSMMIFIIYFLYLTKELGYSNKQAVFLDSFAYLGLFLFDLPTGFISDRFGHKKSFIISNILLIISSVIYFSSLNYNYLIVGSFLYGIGIAFHSGAFDALCVENFKSNIKEFYTNQRIIINITSVITPVITIYIASNYGYRSIYFLDILLKLIIIFITSFFIKEVMDEGYINVRVLKIKNILPNKSIFKTIWNNKFLRIQLGIALIVGVSSIPQNIYFTKFIEISTNESLIGLITTLICLVAVVGSYLVKKIVNERKYYWASMFITGVCVIFAGILLGSKAVIILMLIRSLFFSINECLADTLIAKNINKYRASIKSILSSLVTLGGLIGTIFFGTLADYLGLGSTWVIVGFILILVSLLMKFSYSYQKEIVETNKKHIKIN